MTTNLTCPISPQDAEVIASLLEKNVSELESAIDCADFPEDRHLFETARDNTREMAAAIRAAAREPLTSCFAYINGHGFVSADSDFVTERRAWEVCLGWPSDEEIETRIKWGSRIVRVAIYEEKEGGE